MRRELPVLAICDLWPIEYRDLAQRSGNFLASDGPDDAEIDPINPVPAIDWIGCKYG